MALYLKRASRRGQIVLIALVFFSVFLAISAALISLLTTSERGERVRIAKGQAVALAEGGFDEAVYQLNHNPGYTGETGTALGAGTFTTTVTSVDSSTKRITVTASVPATNPVATKTVTGKVTINTTTVAFRFGVQVGQGGLVMDNNSQVTGNITSEGNISGSGTITGDATVAGGTSATPDQQWTTQNGDTNLGNISAHADLAQSFVPSITNVINSIKLNIKKIGTPSDITLEIVTDSGGSPSKTVLASGTLAASSVTENYALVTGSLTTAPTLTAGTTYWIIAIAAVNAGNYFLWGTDTTDGYPSGTGKASSNWNASHPSWSALGGDLDFQTYMGGIDTSLSGVSVNGTARAHTLASCTVSGDAYYSSSNSCLVTGTAHPGSTDQAPTAMPISAAQISDWEAAAAAGGTLTGPYTVSAPTTLGPKKITGDVTISSTLTLSGPVWVTGNVTFANNAGLSVASSLGNNGAVLLADAAPNQATAGVVTISNNVAISGNGNTGSYPMILSTNTGSSAINLSNNVSGAIIYASAGTISVSNNASANQITAYQLHLNNNAQVNYVNGLASQSFANGPGGSWSFVPGSYGLSP